MSSFEIRNLQQDLETLAINIEDVDTEKIKENTSRRAAEEMAEMVRLAVVAEDGINSPARLQSIYEHGPGPSLARQKAWNVQKAGPDEWSVTPNPKVHTRAVVLNFGYPGKITPNTADVLRFEVDGEPVFAQSVDGPEETGYWQAAVENMRSSGRIEEIAEEELEEELDEAFRA